LLHVGDIQGVHGLKGALTIYSHTRPADGIAGYSCWWVGVSEAKAKAYPVRRCWQHGKRVLAELEGVLDRNAAEALKGQKIWVSQDEVEVADDEYLWEELTGCEVYTDAGKLLGQVAALEEYGAQDILTVRTPPQAAEPGEWMLPFIHDVVLDVDLDARRITVHLLEGMDACFTPGF
jgi:16S rRNA processing protein RimM